MNEMVHNNAKVGTARYYTYMEHLNDPSWEILLLDPKLIPDSRHKYPAYWLKNIQVEDNARINSDMGRIVEAGITTGLTLSQ